MEDNNQNNQNIESVENTPVEEVKEIKTETTENTPEKSQEQNVQENKDNQKDSKFKEEANAAKKFFSNFFRTPSDELKKVIENPKSFLAVIIVVFVLWIVFELIGSIIDIIQTYPYSFSNSFSMFIKNSLVEVLDIFWAILCPAIIVALLSVIIYLFMKDKKKPYLTIASTIIVAKIPVVLSSFTSLFSSISTELSKIINSFSSICSVFSTVLIYIAIKALYNEDDDNKAAKTFLITMAIYYAILLVLKFFNIYV